MEYEIEAETLSDYSTAWNVVGKDPDFMIRFACTGKKHANALLRQLQGTAHTEVDCNE